MRALRMLRAMVAAVGDVQTVVWLLRASPMIAAIAATAWAYLKDAPWWAIPIVAAASGSTAFLVLLLGVAMMGKHRKRRHIQGSPKLRPTPPASAAIYLGGILKNISFERGTIRTNAPAIVTDPMSEIDGLRFADIEITHADS